MLLCLTFSSEALTLGRVRGAALIGKPLDIVVPVQMDPGEDASNLCFDADVFHADTRQATSRVRVLVEASSQPQTANVRVLSSSIVDEPVVTVYLRTGCGQKTTRRYVLLADMPSELAAPLPTALVASVAISAPFIATRASAANAVPARVTAPTVRTKAVSKKTDLKVASSSAKLASSKEKIKPDRPAGQSRLKLDSLDLLSDRVANLDSFMTFEPTEDALQSKQKMQSLEGNLKSLLALVAKNEASVVDLKARLQKAESDRFPQGLIYGLMALVLACLAAIAFLWTRQRRAHEDSEDWWRGTDAPPEELHPIPPESGPVPEPLIVQKALVKERILPKVDLDDSDLDVNLIEMSDSIFDHLMPAEAKAAQGQQNSPPTETAPARHLNSEAMVDICQQAAFFVSLGQADRAVQVLKTHLDESVDPIPGGYLDLLSLFHSLSLKNEFQKYRKIFNRVFSGQVPEFSGFKNEGRDLVSYPDVLARITAFWSTPQALTVIDAYIFQDPNQEKNQSFDLAAFRDLLLLHAVAQSFGLPSDTEGRWQSGLPRDTVLFPHGLDLDLSDLEDVGGASSPVAAVDIPLLMPDMDTNGRLIQN